MADWTQGIPIFLMFIPALTIHEAAHAWVAHRLGDDTAKDEGRLSLDPLVHIDWIGTILIPAINLLVLQGLSFIGWAKPVPVDPRNLTHPRRDGTLIAVAGPASNLLLAFGSLLGLHLLQEKTGAEMLQMFALVNIGLALFNMLPIPPLDGWHCIKNAFQLPEDLAQRGGIWWLLLLLFLINFKPFMDFFGKAVWLAFGVLAKLACLPA